MMSTPPSKPFELAIIGGGITGVTLAIALCKRNISCTIYEQASAFGEIGAGVGLHRNAVRAMGICDEAMVEAFNKVKTRNKWASKHEVWFDFLDGTATEPAEGLMPLFTVHGGHAACHRARFLEELERLLPQDIARFNKHLEDVLEDASGKLVMKFADGSVAEADAVIGCDGIKSRTRGVIVGHDKPEAKCTYSHKFAYRGLIPMQNAIKALGEEKASNASLWMGPNRHALTFPVNHGETLNLVAFVTSDEDWPSDVNLTLPATREDALKDFAAFGPNVQMLIKMTKEKPERWGLFDLADHPLSTFYKGRICVVGDAAHASTPHHGAGAGFCVEDVAVLTSLLADDHVRSTGDLEAVFAAFDANRRERSQWLVQSSRRAADIYEWRAPAVGNRWDQHVQEDIRGRQANIWEFDLNKAIQDAREDLARRLKRV